MARKKKAEEPAVAPLDELHYFATPIYITKQPQFLDAVKAIAADSIKQAHGRAKPNKIHPVLMSGNMLEDPRIEDFAAFVGQTAWNILSSQGYAMDQFSTTFSRNCGAKSITRRRRWTTTRIRAVTSSLASISSTRRKDAHPLSSTTLVRVASC
jgi:hypothetical protein